MRVQLPIPIDSNGRRFVEVDVQAPRTAVLADTQRQVEQSNVYDAMAVFIGGGIAALYDDSGDSVDAPAEVRRLVRMLPYRSAEWVAIQIVLQIDDDDGIEGVYQCPRCHHQLVNEITPEDDYRDHVSDLELRVLPEGDPLTFTVELPTPFEIKDRKTGEILDQIRTIEMQHPTLGICAGAYAKYGVTDDIRRQLAFYVDSMVAVNGQEVDKKFRAEWGMFMFNNMPSGKRGGVALIGAEVRRYGVESTITKTCPKCGKVWDAQVDTSNFFVSALRSL